MDRRGAGAARVDLDQFTPSRRDEDLRATLLAGDDLLLVLCSRLSKEKVPERAVAVLEQLVSRGIRARLVVAGSGPIAARLAANVVARDLPVTFIGHLTERADLAGLLASADLVLAPGPIETFGLAALEALAGGTPVVASRSGALRDVIDGDAGRLATDSDAAFIDAVDDLLSVPETRRRAAARSRAERFPWSETIDAMVRVHAPASVRSAIAGIRV